MKDKQKRAFNAEKAANTGQSPTRQIPASVQKKLIEMNEGDHISTKRQQ